MGWRWLGFGGNRDHRAAVQQGQGAPSQQPRVDGFQDTQYTHHSLLGQVQSAPGRQLLALSVGLLLVSSCPCPVDECGPSALATHPWIFGFTTIVLAARSSQHLPYSLERTRISTSCPYAHLMLACRYKEFHSRAERPCVLLIYTKCSCMSMTSSTCRSSIISRMQCIPTTIAVAMTTRRSAPITRCGPPHQSISCDLEF